MLFRKIGIISIMNYFHDLIKIMVNEGLLRFRKHKSCLPIINCIIGVTKQQTLPHIGRLYRTIAYLYNFGDY